MRKAFSSQVEVGRVRSGTVWSAPGELQRCFFIEAPKTGQTLKIIVSNGADWQESGLSGEPWEHVSVSCRNRCPNWEEMTFVKRLFFDDTETVIQFHPPESDYVNHHPFCLHLWKPPFTVPLPPIETV